MLSRSTDNGRPIAKQAQQKEQEKLAQEVASLRAAKKRADCLVQVNWPFIPRTNKVWTKQIIISLRVSNKAKDLLLVQYEVILDIVHTFGSYVTLILFNNIAVSRTHEDSNLPLKHWLVSTSKCPNSFLIFEAPRLTNATPKAGVFIFLRWSFIALWDCCY